ncbi:non-ribosomal peptide synthetase [Clostridium akagii]|uniref:non-ribosomal peptide synthetase n=1 Tax=Clostridium akagii TaxID=91623 RepID=UPI00047EDC82|nr:non-ribosomal peptide synthetase [Clostridium akagii]
MDNILNYLNNPNKIITIISGSVEDTISPMDLKMKGLIVLNNLMQRGMVKGDKLILKYEDNEITKLLYVFWACLLGGIIPVFISDTGTNIRKLKNIADFIVESKVLLINNDSLDIDAEKKIFLKDILNGDKKARIREIEDEDIAFIQFSSGTTGQPKGAMIKHKNLMASIKAMTKAVESTETDIHISWMPLCHDMGLVGFHLLPIYLKAKQIIIATSKFIRNPLILLEKVSENNATMMNATNFSLKYMTKMAKHRIDKCKFSLQSIRKVVIGAEPINSDIIEEFYELMNQFGLSSSTCYPVYGLAETTLGVAFPRVNEKYKYLSLDKRRLFVGDRIIENHDKYRQNVLLEGYPLFNLQVKFTDNDGEELKDGYVGYINIKGESVIDSYYKNVNSGEFNNGWFNTRDLGFIYNGEVGVLGRTSDVIYVNGKKSFCYEIEEICEKFTKTNGKLCICGINNAEKGMDDIFCFYERKVKNKDKDIINKLNTYLKGQNKIYLNCFVEVDKIYKTTSGKIQRYKLKEEYLDNKEKKFNNIQKRIREGFEFVLEKKIDKEGDFFLNGGDSITAIMLLEYIKEKLDIEISGEVIYMNSSIEKLTQYIGNRCSYEQ